jgi:hypothetical protein
MTRLLIALAIVGLAAYYLLFERGPEEKPEIIYKESTDKARAVEDQLREQAEQQRRQIDDATQ